MNLNWIDAICKVLAEAGTSMDYKEITKRILDNGYRTATKTTENSVNSILTRNPNLFENVGLGIYKLVETSVTEDIDLDNMDWDSIDRDDTPDKPITGEVEGDSTPINEPRHKYVSDFVDSEDLENLSESEKVLLELIVNFRLPLVNEDVCFADILDKLEVEILEEEGSRSQSVDLATLRQRLSKLNEHIEKIQSNPQLGNLDGALLERMLLVAGKARQCLDGAFGDKVEFPSTIFGKFVPESKPKVVIYLKSIENNLKNYENRASVMAGVFVHEMFHAWNYFNAGPRSVLAIDEPMVEFATLYFLKKLKAFTSSQSHSLEGKVSTVAFNRKFRVQNKQQSIGNVAAYGFGYYLFSEFEKGNIDPIQWIETYSKKSASIKSSKLVKNVEDALIPIYPFQSEKQVMEWFKNIIFDGHATSKTVEKSAKNSNTMNDVIYKIRVNRPCRLFIDEEEVMPLKENALTKITLPEGEYLRKVVAEDDSTVFDEKVISLFHPKVDIIALDAIALEEAKRKALPNEIYQSNLYFKPTKDRLSVEVVDKKEYVDAINIPAQIEYAGYVYPVTAVMLTARDLKSITIPNSVKDINFQGCSSLTSITIPDSVTSIGFQAFEGCDRLAAIDYVGTRKQWGKIMKYEFWKPLYERIVIHCTDGDVEVI